MSADGFIESLGSKDKVESVLGFAFQGHREDFGVEEVGAAGAGRAGKQGRPPDRKGQARQASAASAGEGITATLATTSALKEERHRRIAAEASVADLQHRVSLLKQELLDVRKELKDARRKSAAVPTASVSRSRAVVGGVVGVVGATASLGLGLLGLQGGGGGGGGGGGSSSTSGLEGADAAGGDLDLAPIEGEERKAAQAMPSSENSMQQENKAEQGEEEGEEEAELKVTQDLEAMLRENEEVHMRVFQMRRDAQLARESSLSKLAALEEQLGELSVSSSAAMGKVADLGLAAASSEAKFLELREQMQDAREEDSIKLRTVKEKSSYDLRVLRERSEARAQELRQKAEALEFELGRWKDNTRRVEQRESCVLERTMRYREVRKRRNESALAALLPQVASATTAFCNALGMEFEIEASILSAGQDGGGGGGGGGGSWAPELAEAYHRAQQAAAAFLAELEQAQQVPFESSGTNDARVRMPVSLCSGITGVPEAGEHASLAACASIFQQRLVNLEMASAAVSLAPPLSIDVSFFR